MATVELEPVGPAQEATLLELARARRRGDGYPLTERGRPPIGADRPRSPAGPGGWCTRTVPSPATPCSASASASSMAAPTPSSTTSTSCPASGRGLARCWRGSRRGAGHGLGGAVPVGLDNLRARRPYDRQGVAEMRWPLDGETVVEVDRLGVGQPAPPARTRSRYPAAATSTGGRRRDASRSARSLPTSSSTTMTSNCRCGSSCRVST